ncbi:MAG: hypothetical protein E6J41_05115 [Chloroflexi bacterium]|nr:MAG: hypothetical protein E6J41_05115 [Chloroflexota bacterium]
MRMRTACLDYRRSFSRKERGTEMRGLALNRSTALAATGGILLALAGAGGVGYVLHMRPVLHVASTAQECVNAPDHLATLFSDDQNTLIRLSNLDYSDLRVLRTEPAATLPGMFNSLLALSSDSRRLAYVTADNELMDGARIQYVDVASPGTVHPLVQLTSGLAPVRPAWSPNADTLAYVVGRPLSAFRAAGFEVWTVRSDGSMPPQRVTDLPLDVFAHGHSASLCFTAAGQIGLLQGVESAQGPPGPSPLTGAASSARAATPSPSPPTPCGVPVFSQNDPSWQSTIMQLGGDPIGGYGCALTSTTMLLNYYGAFLSPTDLNACLGSAADPIVWQAATGCTSGRVQGGVRADFSWDQLDADLKTGSPAIVGDDPRPDRLALRGRHAGRGRRGRRLHDHRPLGRQHDQDARLVHERRVQPPVDRHVQRGRQELRAAGAGHAVGPGREGRQRAPGRRDRLGAAEQLGGHDGAAGGRRERDAEPGGDADAHADSDRDPHGHADGDPDRDSRRHAVGHGHRHPDGDAHGDGGAHAGPGAGPGPPAPGRQVHGERRRDLPGHLVRRLSTPLPDREVHDTRSRSGRRTRRRTSSWTARAG